MDESKRGDGQRRIITLMCRNNWEKGWLDEILNQAEQEVQSWPNWMQRPEYRHPAPSKSKLQKRRQKMTQCEEKLIRQVVAGNLSKVDVLDYMILSGTIKTPDDYDAVARKIAYQVRIAKIWAESGR